MPQRGDDFQDLVRLYRAGAFAQALAGCEASLRRRESTASLHRLAGKCAAELGRRDAAVGHFRKALSIDPSPEVHVELAAELQGLGRLEQAEAELRLAAELAPSLLVAHLNLGNLLGDRGKTGEAIACYERAIRIDPRFAPAYTNLSLAYQAVGRTAEAFACCRQALAIAPDVAETHFNLGNLFRQANQLTQAAAAFNSALRLNPQIAAGWRNLASTLQGLGRSDEAKEAFRRSLNLDPDHPGARHMLAALEGHQSESPPAGYVRTLFDGYAATFEEDVTKNLDYRIPALIGERLRHHVAGTTLRHRLARGLDLGCGTGLVGKHIKPLLDELDGVDISSKMVEIAGATGVYARLEAADAAAFARSREAETYDVVAAGDVMIYVGALEALFAATARLLRAGGVFVFSVESCDGPGFRLGTAGRYQHSDAYIRRLAEANGMEIVSSEQTTIRKERSEPIPGKLHLLVKGAG